MPMMVMIHPTFWSSARAPRADVGRAQRHDLVDPALPSGGGLREDDDVVPVVQPDFQHQHGHQVPQVDEAEHRHRRRGVWREVHLQRALGMAEMQLQRQGRDQQKRQRGQQREPIGGLYGVHAEDALERRQDERARDQSREERVEHDQHAPLQLDLVGVHEAFNRYAGHVPSYRTEPSRP